MKKTNGVRTPKETGTWYKSLIEGKSKAEYYRHFIKKINDIATEYFGDKEAIRTLKALESKKIQIPNIEMFLFDFNDISDPSLGLYNTCKSPEEFILQSILYFKKRAETGETGIYIKDFFLVLADLLKTDFYSESIIQELLKNFITSLITTQKTSPYSFVIIEPQWSKEIGSKIGLDTSKYQWIFRSLLSLYQEFMNNIKNIKAFLPSLKIIYPVYYDIRDNQLTYLISHFRLIDRPAVVRKALQDISDLSEDTPKLRSALEYLRAYSNLPFLCIDPIIFKLQELGESTYLKKYASQNSLTKIFNIQSLPKNYYNAFDIHPIFTYKETFEQNFRPYFCDVQIDCSKIKKENLESFIDAAKTINLVKGYYNKSKRDINSLTFKITLLNVKYATEDFVQFIKNKLLRIQSSTNKNFIMEIFYDCDIINQKVPEELITHFRVISDIHADYNAESNYHFNFGNDFIVNCGDTGGNAVAAGHWIANYMKRGVVVIGNHLGYSSAHPDRDGIQNMEKYSHTRHPSSTKREQMKELYNLLDKKHVILLSNTCTEFKGIAIIGTCLYTDFNLYGEAHREECMAYAKKYMNDFRLPVVMDNQYYTQDKYGRWWPNSKKISASCVRPFDTSDHAFYFQYSFEYIKKMVEENKHKPIIVVTHHAPSPYSIDEKYEGSLLNAAFASNLNKFIVEHPQIRLWCHGHVHNPCDYILGETRIVCCPFGYNNENSFNLPYEYGLRIPIEEIKSKKSWRKIFCKEIIKGQIQVYDE